MYDSTKISLLGDAVCEGSSKLRSSILTNHYFVTCDMYAVGVCRDGNFLIYGLINKCSAEMLLISDLVLGYISVEKSYDISNVCNLTGVLAVSVTELAFIEWDSVAEFCGLVSLTASVTSAAYTEEFLPLNIAYENKILECARLDYSKVLVDTAVVKFLFDVYMLGVGLGKGNQCLSYLWLLLGSYETQLRLLSLLCECADAVHVGVHCSLQRSTALSYAIVGGREHVLDAPARRHIIHGVLRAVPRGVYLLSVLYSQRTSLTGDYFLEGYSFIYQNICYLLLTSKARKTG